MIEKHLASNVVPTMFPRDYDKEFPAPGDQYLYSKNSSNISMEEKIITWSNMIQEKERLRRSEHLHYIYLIIVLLL